MEFTNTEDFSDDLPSRSGINAQKNCRPGTKKRKRTSETSENQSSDILTSPSNKKPQRIRGRPKGKRVPLNAEERRQRNAQYERERREEMAAAMQELASSINLDESVSNNNIIKSAIKFLHRSKEQPKEDISIIRARNQRLADQIRMLEEKLAFTA